jgi:hypothetical protein
MVKCVMLSLSNPLTVIVCAWQQQLMPINKRK